MTLKQYETDYAGTIINSFAVMAILLISCLGLWLAAFSGWMREG